MQNDDRSTLLYDTGVGRIKGNKPPPAAPKPRAGMGRRI